MTLATADRLDTVLEARILPADQRVVETSPFEQTAIDLADKYPDLIFVAADLRTFTDMVRVAQERPRQFLDVGMAEQNLMTISGGLAKVGFTPVASTFAVYTTRRAFDQMVISMGTGPSRGIVLAFAPGIASSARVHHQATDDLAVMRAVPGVTVIDPVDQNELARALEAAIVHDGLVYLRGMRGVVTSYVEQGGAFQIGAATLLRDGGGVGIISTGIATQWAIEASDLLTASGVEHAILHVPTLKPAPAAAIRNFCRERNAVVTIENHNIIGGLGSLVAEALTEEGIGARVLRRGVPDIWADNGGIPYLRERLGLTAADLANVVKGVAA